MKIPSEDFYTVPSVLYRVFDEEKWALAFINTGMIRLKTLSCFASIEDDIRADPTEGSSSIQTPGEIIKVGINQDGEIKYAHAEPGLVNWRGSVINPIYIYCFSYPPNGDTTLLPIKFGNYIVRIDDPEQLAKDIKDYLIQKEALRDSPVVEYLPVVYNKDSVISNKLDNPALFQLQYTQKSASFSDEYEYRLAIISTIQFFDKYREQLAIDLGKRLTYASLLTR
jgi:hypothetical protein